MLTKLVILGVLTATIVGICPTPPAHAIDASVPASKSILPSIPPGKETDVKLYVPGNAITTGHDAIESMSGANLVLWLAGNQFFAMDEVIAAFQKINPKISVGLITLPPGLLLQAIQSGGWMFQGKQYRQTPAGLAGAHRCISERCSARYG